jgi:hypothetical protein
MDARFMGTSKPFKKSKWLGWHGAAALLVLTSLIATMHECPWLRAHLKPGAEKRVSLLKAASFAEASNVSQLLGVTTAILVLADGTVAPNESAFVDKLISGNSLLAQEQGEFDLTPPMLSRIDSEAWRRQYQACLESYQMLKGGEKAPPFTAGDLFEFKDALLVKVSHTDSPEDDARLLLAFSRLWEGAGLNDASADSQASTEALERAGMIFRKLRKIVSHPEPSASAHEPGSP